MLPTVEPDPLMDALRKIFSTGDSHVMNKEGWNKFQILATDCSKARINGTDCQCGRNYYEILKSLLRDPHLKNISQMSVLISWFANLHFPETSEPISNDIAYFLVYNAPRFNVEIEGLYWLWEIVEEIKANVDLYLPKDQNHINLCTAIVDVLSYIHKPEAPGQVTRYDQDLMMITDFLKNICKHIETDDNSTLSCFKRMCEIFLTEKREDPISSALIVVIRVVDDQVWKQHMPVVVNVLCHAFKDECRIVKMLDTMCRWHIQPMMSMNHMEYLSKWLTQFMEGLEQINKIRIAIEVAEMTLPDIILRYLRLEKFYQIEIQDNVVLYLISKVSSLELYHVVIRSLNMYISNVEKTNLPANHQKILQMFVKHMTLLSKRFNEHSLRSPCLICDKAEKDIIKFFNDSNKPSSSSSSNVEEVEEMEVSYPSTSSGHGKIDPSKVGLRNLGNTCYMNSVLQALVMTRKFCHEVLLYKTTNDSTNQTVLKNLQNLFALLKYSQRNSLAPTEILQACRPAYFMLGHQQDSSEFLCHLLDVMYEQEKSALMQSNVSDQNFSVKVKTEDKEIVEMEEAAGGTNSPLNDDGTSQNMTRWTTETNLSEGACLQRKTQSLADFTQGEELAQAQNGLSDSHSDSTDSGIQSVGGEDTASSTSSTGASTSDYLVHRVFGGELKVSYLCLQCETQSDNTDKFRDLQLCFLDDLMPTDTVTVQDLINTNYLKPESLTGDNKYRCDKCAGLCDAERIIKILQAPAHLILTLKHFRYDSESRLRTKLRRKVTYNETIRLPISDQDPETYQLYAAVVHSGYSMDYGHYVTYACDGNNRWYKFNDSYVSETTLEDFKRLEPPDTPYILFYKKCSDPSVDDAPEMSLLSKTLQEYVVQDKRKSIEERRKAKLATDSYEGSRFNSNNSWDRDKSDDDDGNPPPSNCRDAFSIPNRQCLF